VLVGRTLRVKWWNFTKVSQKFHKRKSVFSFFFFFSSFIFFYFFHTLSYSLNTLALFFTFFLFHFLLLAHARYMGERNTLKMPHRITELLASGVMNDRLRDEVYLHIMKQCTANGEDLANANKPGWQSHANRGLELMALVALVFPPSPQVR
jgi:hypothetical protein